MVRRTICPHLLEHLRLPLTSQLDPAATPAHWDLRASRPTSGKVSGKALPLAPMAMRLRARMETKRILACGCGVGFECLEGLVLSFPPPHCLS